MTKTLWLKDAYLQMILAGCKTIKVRVAYSNIARLQVGDQLRLNGQHTFVITRIARYASFDELRAREDVDAIAPGFSHEELGATLRALYPREKESLGVVALEIIPDTAPHG
ncbi:MAG: hypothetical protein HY868_14415 [Chloroflexi bacterium]|nr:hypothetical protein [Chloroflexota bacterium]